MKYVNRLLNHKEYQEQLAQLKQLEQDRIYCRHGIDHLLAVARIAQLKNLERKHRIDKEEIYLAALLHDLGRVDEYKDGTPHEEAGIRKAEYFLEQISIEQHKKKEILHAILKHREKETQAESVLAGLIKEADKESRNCLFCAAYESCKWSADKKNHVLWD